jgi:mono/diheme cytochrome c family protein
MDRVAQPRPRFQFAAESKPAAPVKAGEAVDGAAAFQERCTSCHDAERSFQKKKSISGWRITIKRMAAKEDADIPEKDREPIAKYLASRNAPDDINKPQPDDNSPPEKETPSPSAKESGKDKEKPSADDSALIEQGKTAFNSSCTTCHDAEKSLQQTKSLSAWRTTVRRMAAKDGANIPESSHEAIAKYLASLGNQGKGEKAGGGEADAGPTISIAGTLSARYRTSGDPNLEDPGNFGSAWLGFSWQPKGPVSGRVTTCISCHTSGLQLGSFELVEATLRLDVNKCLCPNNPDALPVKINIEAGRFVVPFGAYYQQVNPGVDRAVSQPLIYNMGERIYPNSIGDPVLPMPDADEGASLNISFPIHKSINVTFNSYIVNGLEGNNTGIDFYESRDYVDNNRWPAAGGRITVGGSMLRLGTSVMGGRFNGDLGAGPDNAGLNYLLFGADLTFHWKDIFRLQFEYAQRNSDRYGGTPQPTVFSERVEGYYLESELQISRKHHISLFGRYDWQLHGSRLPVPGSQITSSDFIVDRLTYGVNWTLPGGSLLMANHEIWNLPQGLGTANVFGVRWAATF